MSLDVQWQALALDVPGCSMASIGKSSLLFSFFILSFDKIDGVLYWNYDYYSSCNLSTFSRALYYVLYLLWKTQLCLFRLWNYDACQDTMSSSILQILVNFCGVFCMNRQGFANLNMYQLYKLIFITNQSNEFWLVGLLSCIQHF